MSKFNFRKLLPVCIAISAVIVLAGIILYALLGFNTASDNVTQDVLDVKYDNAINPTETAGNDETLQTFVEDQLRDGKITFEKTVNVMFSESGTSLGKNSYTLVRYTLHGGSAEAYAAVAAAVNAEINAHSGLITDSEDPDIYFFADASAEFNRVEMLSDSTPAWRGAIALAVGAIVALAYVTFRFGVSCGVAGLVTCVHDALFTLALFAITRIPVFSFAPVLYAAVAMLVSAVVWMVYAHKIRTNYKEPEFASLSAEEVADRTRGMAWKSMLAAAGLFALVLLVVGLCGAVGTMSLVLPALIGAVVPVLSNFVYGPAVFAAVRKTFDKRRAVKNRVYVGKKKKAESEE